MAQLSGSEPISAANLAGVLGSAGLGRDVLLTLTASEIGSGFTFFVCCGDGEYSSLLFEYAKRQGASTGWTSGEFEVPFTEGFHDGLSHGFHVEISRYNGFYEVDVRSAGAIPSITRIVGIRSGGGQLLADLLHLLGEVA